MSTVLATPSLAGRTVAAASTSGGHDTQLILAAVIGIAVIIGLITFFKLHPFLSLMFGSVLVGAIAGLPLAKTVTSLTNGFGATAGSVGTLIALGAIFGKLLADSGGADQIVDTIVGKSTPRTLPWAMALVGMVIGLPMFFEIGLVLLMPVILLVARRSGQSMIRIGIPTLAGLSAMHGFIPPHPGPVAAVNLLHANLGLTLGLGIIVAIPSVIIAGPVFGQIADRWVHAPLPDLFVGGSSSDSSGEEGTRDEKSDGRAQLTDRRPSFGLTLATVFVPITLMLAAAIVEVTDADGNSVAHRAIAFVGTPIVALMIAVLIALFTFGVGVGLSKEKLSGIVDSSLGPIAGIFLIVCAGGAFKQVLVDSGISNVISNWVEGSSVSPLILAWFVAVLLRVSTGSATVATVTTAGILAPVASTLTNSHLSLLVLAIGAGSLFFSHVNDAGFWLVKSYFNLSVGDTIKSWSIMESVISVVGIIMVLLLSVVV